MERPLNIAASGEHGADPLCEDAERAEASAGITTVFAKAPKDRQDESDLALKLQGLYEHLKRYEKVALGFSGGVDSTFLAAVCGRCIPERTTLIHLNTPFIPTPERKACEQGLRRLGLPVMRLNVDPLSCPQVAANPHNRCYRCKRLLFEELTRVAAERGIDTVLDGSNADDAADYRPGMKALHELGVRSPLLECGWSKAEERAVLRAWGFDVWDMPAGACLATRIACEEPITLRKLEVIRACEDRVRREGVRQVRARLSNGAISIHVDPSEMPLITMGGMDKTLLPHLMHDLQELAAGEVSPFVQPYRHGETSVRTA